MTARRFLTVAALVLILSLATILAGCSSPTLGPSSSGGSSKPAATATPTPNPATGTSANQGHTIIVIKDFSFTPTEVTVKVGAQVIWQNEGKASHTVAFDDGSVSSPDIPSGGTASHVFAKAGTFAYHCARHPQMKGTVIVK